MTVTLLLSRAVLGVVITDLYRLSAIRPKTGCCPTLLKQCFASHAFKSDPCNYSPITRRNLSFSPYTKWPIFVGSNSTIELEKPPLISFKSKEEIVEFFLEQYPELKNHQLTELVAQTFADSQITEKEIPKTLVDILLKCKKTRKMSLVERYEINIFFTNLLLKFIKNNK